jgi:hypothetical protein
MNVIDVLEQTPERVRSLIAGQSEEALSFKPAPDEFSLRENVLHLRDIDVDGYEQRIIRILSDRDPVFPDVDGAALARERNYNAQPVAPALEAFAASRARSFERLRAIAPADLERTGELEGAGRFGNYWSAGRSMTASISKK